MTDTTSTTAAAAPGPRPIGPEAERKLGELDRLVVELEAAETDAKGWRDRRNAKINEIRGMPEDVRPTLEVIAARAHVNRTFVSRILSGKGRPGNGHGASA